MLIRFEIFFKTLYTCYLNFLYTKINTIILYNILGFDESTPKSS